MESAVSVQLSEVLKYDANGLIPAIAQDAENGDVLMHAYMNAEAVARTLETGLAHYYSRSRGRIWRKGEESGHVQRIREIRYDCDADTLLLRVDQEVAACHTGNRSCFYRSLGSERRDGTGPADRRFDPAEVYRGLGILASLFAVIEERRRERPAGSYVASLFAKGGDQVMKKVAEEAAEVLLAAKGGDRTQVVYEMADLWFHCLVLLAQHGIRPEEIAGELGHRYGKQKADYGGPPPRDETGH
ncbi:MAG: bifunctional phosphoribosyl-AMP cyclohydrolase/phosphoribosyl-ATP diphosphatase HisIE [candidate division NC10 bacterium]|nr:bifunctional phosphoribosyl-AMP cyclohydrolase/phosphoribosyl-ATP diphosphatase HisIE [candidate division NC10 bacterium]